jgi:mono/diheme cytochrome c family protein
VRANGGSHYLHRYALGVLALLFVARGWADEAPDMSGADLYKEFCATCHGKLGTGNGPLASSLRQTPPNLTLLAKRHGGVFPAEEIHRIIDGRSMRKPHGSSDMPVWGWAFYAYEGEDAARRQRVAELIDQLVEFLRSIQK